MLKIDYKKQLKHLYNPSKKEINITDVPKMNFLMIDGKGDPNTSKPFQNAIEALYSVSYTLKFIIKKEKEIDYGVLPLEGLWWCEDMSKFNWVQIRSPFTNLLIIGGKFIKDNFNKFFTGQIDLIFILSNSKNPKY